MKIHRRWQFILAAIVAFGLLLRLWDLGVLPSGFHNDEVMNGYVGRYTLENGVDLYGNRWPLLHFDNFGDYPNILPMYLSGLSTYVFGVNPFGVRFPIAAFGAITVGLVYLLARKLFENKNIALISALILALSPWHIVLSRATAEGVTAAAVFLIGLLLLLNFLKTNSSLRLLAASGVFLLTYFLYPSYRMFIPLILWPSFLLAKRKSNRLALIFAAVLFTILTMIISQTVWGKGRYDQTSVFGFNDVLKIRVTQEIYTSREVPILVTRAFHNKIWKAGREVLKQYSDYWSGSYLFLRGGLPGRYLLSDQGLFFISTGLLAATGLVSLILNKRTLFDEVKAQNKPLLYYFLFILILSPLPAAMTLEDAPNIHRSLLMGVLLPIVLGYLVWQAFSQRYAFRQFILSVALLFSVYELMYFGHLYHNHATVSQAAYRNQEAMTVARLIASVQPDYTYIYAPQMNQLPLRLLFNAARFDKTLAGTFETHIYTHNIDNIFFSKNSCPADELSINTQENILLVARIECQPHPDLEPMDVIKRTDGHDAFAVWVSRSD